MSVTRRNFIKAVGATAMLAAGPRLARAASSYRVVVIGGGFAGATVAKYLRMWSGRAIDVTLVDPNSAHTTCVLSNLVLNGRMRLSELQMPLSRLYTNHGVTVLQDTAEEINADGHQVRLASKGWVSYDRLVLAPGISFDAMSGLDFSVTPHAWLAGPQTTLLRNQLLALRKGDRFVMTIPEAPYRCPPGPYERACVVADMLKRLGGGKVTILDANPDIVAEKHTFDTAFKTIYKDIVEYRHSTPISSISSADRTVNGIKGNVVNVIAPHSAPALLKNAGLTGGGKWAPVDPLTYESTAAGRAGKGIHIIGDSCTAPVQPKSGHMANSQAKVCADAIVRYSLGFDPLADQDRTTNITTNSACYSPITYSEASWLTANYRYDASAGKMVLTTVAPGEAQRWDGENFEDMFTWASNLFTDCFT